MRRQCRRRLNWKADKRRGSRRTLMPRDDMLLEQTDQRIQPRIGLRLRRRQSVNVARYDLDELALRLRIGL